MFNTDLKVGLSLHSMGGSLAIGRYLNGEIALAIIAPDGQREAVATVAIDREENAEDSLLNAWPSHVWLKGWSENDGIPQALEEAGAVRLLNIYCPCGPYGCQAQLAEVKEPLKSEINASGLFKK